MTKKNGIAEFVEKTTKTFDPITFFTNTKFKHIFIFWILVILLFGIGYFGLTFTEHHSLLQDGMSITKDMSGLFNSFYFSVISATATGYGDIIPRGFSKLLAIFEVITGLIIFGMLISKLVSYKQEVILEEVYEISFDEKINRLRSALYLFRADMLRLMEKVEALDQFSKRKRQDLWVLLTSLENTMEDIDKLLCPKRKKDFTKKIDELKLELILNSIDLSLSRVLEMIKLIESKKEKDWMTEKISQLLRNIQKYSNSISEYYRDKPMSSKIKNKVKDMANFVEELDKVLAVS